MFYKILYHPKLASHDIPSIPQNIQSRIKKAIEQRLCVDPILYGEPLRKGLKGYRKLRVGDYRVIYEVQGNEVRIYAVGNRKEIYKTSIRSWP